MLLLWRHSWSAMMVRRATYDTAGCVGTPYFEEFLLTGCSGEGFVKMTCSDTGVSASLHENEDCSGNASSTQLTAFNACENKQKIVSCTDMEGYPVASYNASQCDDSALVMQALLPSGCRATGRFEGVTLILESQYVQLVSRNLVVRTYSDTSVCAGNHSEERFVELPCGASCVDGNSRNGLTNGTWFSYLNSCRTGISAGQRGRQTWPILLLTLVVCAVLDC